MDPTVNASQDEPFDFSLVLGGPLFQAFRRAHLAGPALELVPRRIAVFVAITWIPLAVLSAIGGHLLGGPGLPFLRDIEMHVRLLIAVPLLFLAELIVHQRLRPLLRSFVERGIIRPEDMPRFLAARDSAVRLRDSIPLEIAIFVFAATVGHWIWLHKVAMGGASWYALPGSAGLELTLPGSWYGFVSLPLAQFIIFRWYVRLAVWCTLLWRVSRLDLRLVPTHPDGAGGIGFLGMSTHALSPILFAQGAALCGVIATRVLYQGQNLMSFRESYGMLVVFFLLVMLGPLVVFAPALARAKRRGLVEYGALAMKYVDAFDAKWLRGGAQGDVFLGSGDIQSLADLGNSFATVKGMRTVPFSRNDVMPLVVAAVVPMLPLVLVVIPLNELVDRVLKVIM